MECDANTDELLPASEWRSPVRHEWSYQVRAVCQRFYLQTVEADRHAFEDAVNWLLHRTPAANSLQEADWLKTIVKDAVVSSGIRFHRGYHEHDRTRLCAESPIEAVHHVWGHHDDDPRITLKRWRNAFLRVFDRTHPPSMVQRAAAVLRVRFRRPPGLTALSELLATSRSTLAREFKAEFGVTCGEYVARVRLRRFVTSAREHRSSLGALAEACGYRSYHNLVDSLKGCTGLTPGAIQALESTQLEHLFDTRLSVPTSRGRRLRSDLSVGYDTIGQLLVLASTSIL